MKKWLIIILFIWFMPIVFAQWGVDGWGTGGWGDNPGTPTFGGGGAGATPFVNTTNVSVIILTQEEEELSLLLQIAKFFKDIFIGNNTNQTLQPFTLNVSNNETQTSRLSQVFDNDFRIALALFTTALILVAFVIMAMIMFKAIRKK